MENQESKEGQEKLQKEDQPANIKASDPKESVEGSDVDYPAEESPYADLTPGSPSSDTELDKGE